MLNNYYEKEIIKDPRRIYKLAVERKSVEVKFGIYKDWQIIPCAFIQNWQFRYLMTFINQRKIREHETNGEKLEKAKEDLKKELLDILIMPIINFINKFF